MTHQEKMRKIAALGRVCGIIPAYRDNFGRRRATSAATYRALLTAMGVPWEDPVHLDEELARRRRRPPASLLEPVQVVFPAPGRRARLPVSPWLPGAEPPPRLEVQGELTSEDGRRLSWEASVPVPAGLRLHPSEAGGRLRLALPLPRLEWGYYDLTLAVRAGSRVEKGRARLIAAPRQVYLPECLAAEGRVWGLSLPLYALSSETDWGIGDFGDLAALIPWAASLGAAFVGVNPLHAPAPDPGHDPSPYSPSSRLFLNFEYLNLKSVPELAACPGARALLAGPAWQEALTRLRAGEFVDYPEVFQHKLETLRLLFQTFEELHGLPPAPRTPRGREFARFLEAEGEPLAQFGRFCALADHFRQADWRLWPPACHHPEAPAVAAFAREHPLKIAFHQYVQWLAAVQLEDAATQARLHRLPFSLYHDLALGSHPGGFDVWANPGLFALDAAMGAPPDAFNPRGQDWGLPPPSPQRLRDTGYRFFIDTLRANCPPDGILRLDHVMGLFRLYWIPRGFPPSEGAYVAYPARDLLGVLALESHRRRTLIVGEDLGTLTPRIRRDLEKTAVFSYRVFYFERGREDAFTPPEDYPRRALAAVTTHDLPTLTAYWTGADIDLKKNLHLYPDPRMAAADAASRRRDRARLVAALSRRGLLPPDAEVETDSPSSCPEEVRFGVLEYLAQSPAALLEVRLEEVFGLAEQQNLPGTTTEAPNWRRKLPLTLEALGQAPEPPHLASRLNRWRGQEGRSEEMSGGGGQGQTAPALPPNRLKEVYMLGPALIYNLFPPLVGPINRWEVHLDRIAAMGFTWIYLNPIHTPGLSGSLYAVKDYFGLNPLFYPEDGSDPQAALARFLKEASRRGLRVMLDLVINHTAIDSPLTRQHPEWYARDEAGRIKHPGAIDPADARRVTVWGDLAELEYWPPPDPEGLLHFWDQVLAHYLRLGFMGFRADAAYKIPGWFWARLIDEARALEPGVEFFAETLGCRLEECAQLSSSGFDFLYNSSKWWDFQADWCLEQYNAFRRLAPSVSFPETHDTERLAAESRGDPQEARLRYLFAAYFSTSLMMPVGFEFGFRKKLHVVKTRPRDWEPPSYDLTAFITRVNRRKLACPVLLTEGPQVRLSAPEEPVVLLLKSRDRGPGRVLAVLNPSPEAQPWELTALPGRLGGPPGAWRDLTPEAPPLVLKPGLAFTLAPWEMRIFYNHKGKPLPEQEATDIAGAKKEKSPLTSL